MMGVEEARCYHVKDPKNCAYISHSVSKESIHSPLCAVPPGNSGSQAFWAGVKKMVLTIG